MQSPRRRRQRHRGSSSSSHHRQEQQQAALMEDGSNQEETGADEAGGFASQQHDNDPTQDDVEMNPSSSSSSSSPTTTRNDAEMGYLLLEECTVHLAGDEMTRELPRQQWLRVNPTNEPNQKWDVDLKTPSTKNASEHEKQQKWGNGDNHRQPCCHCNLVFHTTTVEKEHKTTPTCDGSSPLVLYTNSESAPRFQGTVADMVHHVQDDNGQESNHNKNNNTPHLCHDKKCREDAALLMGAILQAQDFDYVSIQELQLLLLPPNNNNGTDDDENVEENGATSPTFQTRDVRASLLVTLAFPNLLSSTTTTTGSDDSQLLQSRQRRRGGVSTVTRPPRSIQPTTATTKKSANNITNILKPLPPSVQFILSVIRSDWNRLEGLMQQLARTDLKPNQGMVTKQKANPTFFPSKLSLEELYCRIRGSSSRINDDLLWDRNNRQPQSSKHHNSNNKDRRLDLVSLPMDILKTQIAPFLRAKSLDALRCTCKSLHQHLQNVVPGLKLRLFRHQVTSLQWMRQREIQAISEVQGQQIILTRQNHNSNHNCNNNCIQSAQDDNDPVRAMTGGQSVWLCPRPSHDGSHSIDPAAVEGIRFDQMTGTEMRTGDDNHGTDVLARRGARGGLLCDDPGLGKTITILSLILQTWGVSTETESSEVILSKQRTSDKDDNKVDTATDSPEEQIFQAYWQEQVPAEFRRPALCRLMRKLKRLDVSAHHFVHPIDPESDDCEDYFDVIKEPICFDEIDKKISEGAYGRDNSDFDVFVSDVELCFRNAMEYNPEGHEVNLAARNLLHRFRGELVVEFKQQQLGSLRSSACNTSLKPNSSVALLMQRKSEQEFHQSLIQSSSTLLVIPSVLMEHWEEQFKMHVDLRYCTNRIPLIYEYTSNRKSALGLEEALRQCQVDKTHEAILFVDKAGTSKLPSAEFLAMFRVVITTTKRFTNEWKNGSFQEELQHKRTDKESSTRDGKYVNYRLLEYGPSEEEACPLLKVNWLRMVVDEGHSMGRGKGNSAIRFASWITAQRRWAITGTPTQQKASQNGLNNIHGLLQFLQHDFFSPRRDGDKVWKRLVARSWTEGHLAAFFRLKSLLSLLMIRHTKLDIEELPPPTYVTKFVSMSPLEITTYNTVVSAVQANLTLTGMKGSKTSGQQDSLLNRTQAKHALLALTNIRRVCVGGTRVVPTVEHRHYVEFVSMCRFHHGMPDAVVHELELYLGRATTEQLSRCNCCGMLLSMLLVMPCGCLLCPECTDKETNVCVMCDKPFDVDEFQKLQPGMVYEWLKTEDDLGGRAKAKIPKAVDTITNPVVHDHDYNNNENGAIHIPEERAAPHAGPEQHQLLLRPPSERRRTRKPGDGHVCEYSRSFEEGKCLLCFEMHNHCKLVNKDSCCQICYQQSQDCPESESKSHYLVGRLLHLYEEDQKKARDFMPTSCAGVLGFENHRRAKVIVFSQFREALNLVGNRLLRKFGTACVAEYWGSYRTAELHKFIYDPDCFVMLLGKDGSEGLDLSFVTHIFFLEAVWDKSLVQQAVARAWRMGATGTVEVETLLAKTSVEEQMYRVEEATDEKPTTAAVNDDNKAKVAFFLKALKLIPDIENCPLPHPEQVEKRFGTKDSPLAAAEPRAACEGQHEPNAKRRKTSPRSVSFMV